jgi:hypothetical protein
MTDEKSGIWQGGTTNESKEKAIQDWNRMIRESEDYIDTLDIEKEFNPKNNINKNMDKPSPISGGDPKNRYRSPEGDKVK